MAIPGREARAVGGTGVVEEGWPELLAAVGSAVDLEASARASGARVRARRVKDGATLLRLALAYGGCGLSLRQTAAWAAAQGVAELSDVAVLGRLAGAAGWLEAVAGALLAARVAPPESGERRAGRVDGDPGFHPRARPDRLGLDRELGSPRHRPGRLGVI